MCKVGPDLKFILRVPNVNNEITYVESSRYPLRCKISKQQLKFWQRVQEFKHDNPDSALSYLLNIATEINIPYTRHYVNLARNYSSSHDCLIKMQNEYKNIWKTTFANAAHDSDSRLGTYYAINPRLLTPSYLSKTMFETDRQILTRFRCGSHSLGIETGRYNNIPRDRRLCTCGIGIQTIIHCFIECPLVLPFLRRNYSTLTDIFEDDDIPSILHRLCKELKISV